MPQKAVEIGFDVVHGGLQNLDALNALLDGGWKVNSVNPSSTGPMLVIIEKSETDKSE